jgi:class 3 adenylate cyclase
MPSRAAATASRKTVVELDLVGYSSVARTLEENLGVEVVARFNQQIQTFVDAGLKAVHAGRERAVKATTGDGAILAFGKPADAHRFAEAVHKAAEAHNQKRTEPSAQRWFRIGIATGDLDERPRAGGGREIAGVVIANAVRLEGAAKPGQTVADAATFDSLPPSLRKHYGPEEIVRGKREERFVAHRCTVIAYAVEEGGPATTQSVLDLFDRLNPRDQLDRLMIVLNMPVQFRPPKTLTVFDRQDALLDWASGPGAPGLEALSTAVKELIRRQQPGV